MAKFKVAKEELELETVLAESSTKLKVLNEYKKSEDGLSCHTLAKKLRGGNLKHVRTSFSLLQPHKANFHTPPQMLQSVDQHDLNYNAQTNRGDEKKIGDAKSECNYQATSKTTEAISATSEGCSCLQM